MNRLKKHLSVANALSCMALFVALSGIAYAAIGPGAVKTKNIAKGAVTTPKLRGGAVTTQKLRNGAVTGPKVADGTIGSSQLANGAIRSSQLGGSVVTEPKLKDHAVSGDKIANGAIYGPQLAPDSVGTGKILDGSITAVEISPALFGRLFKDLSYATKTSESNTSATKSLFTECPFGKEAISGGAQIVGNNTGVAITKSAPNLGVTNTATSWTATAQAIGTQTDPWAIEVNVVCAEV